MAVEREGSQTACEMTDPMDQTEMANTLREFGKSIVALRDVMDQNKPFNDMELLFIENHFQLIQMAYFRWKRKHRRVPVDLT